MQRLFPQRLLLVPILSAVLFGNLLVPISRAQTPSTAQTSSTSQPASNHDTRDNVKCGDNGTYINSQGQKVKRPENCSGSRRSNCTMPRWHL
jgi:hypothetical protein